MQLVSVKVEQAEGGRIVTVAAFFEGNEVIETGDVGALDGFLQEAAGLGDAVPAEAPPTEAPAPAAGNAASEPQRRTRRTKTEMEAARAAESANPTEGAGTGRRRRAGAETAGAPAADASSTDTPTATDAPSEGRRRRAVETTAPEVTDAERAECSKAASEAAQKLTPNVVKEIMAEGGIAGVQDIKTKAQKDWLIAELAFQLGGADHTVPNPKG